MPPAKVNRVIEDKNSKDFLDEVTGALDDEQPYDLAAEYEEMGVPRPDERLSDAFPDEFAIYCQHFIDVFPRSPYYVRTTYDNASRFGGWPEKKSRKTGRPLFLIDNGDFLNRTDCVERHLDYEQWVEFKDTTDPYRDHKIGDFYWLGLTKPRKTTFHAIDLDNKRFIGHYRSGSKDNDPVMPVVHMPLDHFQTMKRIYDSFPNRIWCITSETLGLDIFERHALQRTDAVHTRTKRQLARIGLGKTEVHPMEGRCKRRPFGEHYRTITADDVVEPWQKQLDYYLTPGPTPSFDHICRTMLRAVKDQWTSWISFGDVDKRVEQRAIVRKYRPELVQVLRWLQDGCPLDDPVRVVVSTDVPGDATDFFHRPQQPTDCPPILDFNMRAMRGGNWAKTLEHIAFHGLPCEDSVGEIVFELAKFLWWIELFHLPENIRDKETLRLLKHFVNNKHNNNITRWKNDEKRSVLKQIIRCLGLAKQLDENHREESLQLFNNIRQKREQGQYRRVINLAVAILSVPEVECSSTGQGTSHSITPSSWSTYFSVGTLEALDAPLPSQIIELIDKHRGRNKIIPYATRLLNHLYQNNHICRLPHEALSQLLGYPDRKRTTKYNKILNRADLLEKDHSVRGKRSCGYWLSEKARMIMDDANCKLSNKEMDPDND